MSAFPQIKLKYFNVSARAESIRLAFYIGNVPFEDVRVSREEFEVLKETLPFGQLPVIEVDGEVIAQSQGLLRYAGRLANMYPVNDPMAALKIDEILGSVEEVMDKLTPSFREKDPEKKKVMREEMANIVFPRFWDRLDHRLAKMKEYAVFQTDDLFIHELFVNNTVSTFRMGVIDHIPTTICDGYPAITALVNKVTTNPKLKEYYANPRDVAPKLKLTYFDFGGRAEAIRLAFHIGGIEFEDERIARSELETIRPSLPFGQVPVLTINGEPHAQSLQILRYAGTLSGLYPRTDFKKALRIDEVLGFLDEFNDAIFRAFRTGPETAQIALQVTIPNGFDALNKRIAARGGKYTVGDELTIADLAISGSFIALKSGRFSGVPSTILDDYEQITRILEQVAAHPKLQEWHQKTN